MAADGVGTMYCTACGTPHHTECWEENGGCTVFGCSAAPPEEPKLRVAPADLPSLPAAGEPMYSATPTFGYGAAAFYAPPPQYLYQSPPKSRVEFIVLGVFLGAFGAHNFYAGYTGRAIAQLSITLGTLFMGAIVSWIWALVEVCTVDRDSRNVYMV
jgi:TM2 domain-containing membrane protein YozV